MQTDTAQPAEPHYRFTRILVVEDCKSDVALLEQLLEDCNMQCFYEISDVPSLVDAFYSLDREHFDMVMLDLNLLDVDDVANVAALHAQVPMLPLIVYSGMDDDKIKDKALMCGASHYFVKSHETGQALKQIIENAAM